MNETKYCNNVLLNNLQLPKNWKEFSKDIDIKNNLQLCLIRDCFMLYLIKNLLSK